MLTRLVPDLPQPSSSAPGAPSPTLADRVSQLGSDIQAIRQDHMNLLQALAVAFALLNQQYSLAIADATIDASPIGATTPSTGAFTSLNVGADGAITHLKAGTYTPTLTGVANLTAVTAYQCQYLRIGNVVVVGGKFDADPAAVGTAQFAISLPIASNFGAAEDCGGTAAAPAVAGQCAAIYADATNDRAQVDWTASDLGNRAWWFTFVYEVI